MKFLQELKLLLDEHIEYIEIITKDYTRAAFILENDLNIYNFKIIDNSIIRIYDLPQAQQDISKTLILKGVEIESINKENTSLEDYFLKLLDGSGLSA